jgi:hypothetical protein
MQRFALLMTMVLICSSVATAAEGESPARRDRGGLYGDWNLKFKFGERDMNAILSFSRDEEGNLTADWISFWGVNRLRDVKFQDGNLSFLQITQFRDEEYRSTFTGTIEEDKLQGILSGQRGDSDVVGERSPRTPRASGTWELKYKIGDQAITSALVIKADKEGELSAEWKNDQAQVEVSDLNYQRGSLTLKRKTKMADREWDSTFEGSIDRQMGLLKGTIKSEMGEVPVEGKRMGESLIGVWNLDITTEEREFKQRLRVNPDMSALYGVLPIKKIELKDNKVTFEAKWEFGDRTFEMSFDGQLVDEKLTGEITTSRGTRKIEGTKRIFRRR